MTGISAGYRADLGRSWLSRSAWVAVLVGGVAAYLLVLVTVLNTNNLNLVPSLLLLGSVVAPATVLVFAVSGGRQVIAPTGLVVLTALAGGVIGTVAAGTLEYDTLRELRVLPTLLIGLIEEAAKLIVPVLALVILRRRDPRWGVIVGIASGMGFASLETMGYGFHALLSSRGDLTAVDDTLLLRALLSPAGHIAWTGLTVAAVWLIPGAASKGRAVGRAAAAFVLAVILHAAWDAADGLPVHIAVAAVSVVLLLILVHRAHSVPRAITGPGAGTLNPEIS
jgi:RsiW-degrading membrane proteinase PrsW (M82 family)